MSMSKSTRAKMRRERLVYLRLGNPSVEPANYQPIIFGRKGGIVLGIIILGMLVAAIAACMNQH